MPIRVGWDNEAKTIIRFDFEGKWTWEDFQIVQTEANRLISSVDHTVDIIFDVQNSAERPNNLMMNMRRFGANNPSNSGRKVIVRKSQFTKTMISTYSRLFGKKVNPDLIHADTIEEARNILKSV